MSIRFLFRNETQEDRPEAGVKVGAASKKIIDN